MSTKQALESKTTGSEGLRTRRSPENPYEITHLPPGADEEDVRTDLICAPSRAAAAIRAQMLFPGSRILAVHARPQNDHATPTCAPSEPGTHGARFIRGLFRPALFHDEREIDALTD